MSQLEPLAYVFGRDLFQNTGNQDILKSTGFVEKKKQPFRKRNCLSAIEKKRPYNICGTLEWILTRLAVQSSLCY